jgi:hypothetical protein
MMIGRIRENNEGGKMTTYAVQRTLPGISMEQLAAAQRSAIQASKESTDQGNPVSYIRSNFYPNDQRCTCLFEAQSREAVESVNKAASIPFDKVEELIDIPPLS